MREPIYVVGQPKSGTSWLARLIGDAINCPVGGSTQKEDDKEFAAEGWDRPGKNIVRKGHYKLIDDDHGPFVPASHKMAWKMQKDEKVIFIIRDPRDMAVSHAHYWKRNINIAVDRVSQKWAWYNESFIDFPSLMNLKVVKYEALHKDPLACLDAIVRHCGYNVCAKRLQDVIERQSFEARKKRDTSAFHQRFLRKGIVGDWVNRLDRDNCEKIDQRCGEFMLHMGYIQDRDWWRDR